MIEELHDYTTHEATIRGTNDKVANDIANRPAKEISTGEVMHLNFTVSPAAQIDNSLEEATLRGITTFPGSTAALGKSLYVVAELYKSELDAK